MQIDNKKAIKQMGTKLASLINILSIIFYFQLYTLSKAVFLYKNQIDKCQIQTVIFWK